MTAASKLPEDLQMSAQEDYETRFSGWDLATLTSLAGLGQASYDYEKHCWYVSSPMTHRAGLPSVVPDVDWPGAPTPDGASPLIVSREAIPGVRVGLDEDLATVLDVPAGGARLTADATRALSDAIGEARQLRALVEADRAVFAEMDGLPDIEAGS
jgi:hypothetical protein